MNLHQWVKKIAEDVTKTDYHKLPQWIGNKAEHELPDTQQKIKTLTAQGNTPQQAKNQALLELAKERIFARMARDQSGD